MGTAVHGMRCEACGVDYPAGKRFCQQCGQPLVAAAVPASGETRDGGRRWGRAVTVVVLAVVAIGLVAAAVYEGWWEVPWLDIAPRIQELPMSRLLELVRENEVARVSFGEKEIRGWLKRDAVPDAPSTGTPDWLERLTGSTHLLFSVVRIPGVDEAALLRELEAHRVKIDHHTR